jgi:hypothetical protein
MKIKIVSQGLTLEAELFDTPCARAIGALLPFSASVNTWGEEIYFSIPVNYELDSTARDIVEVGDLGYWPEGPAFCIFFGPTPISQGKEIRPASKVNIVGKLCGDPKALSNLSAGTRITLEPVPENE